MSAVRLLRKERGGEGEREQVTLNPCVCVCVCVCVYVSEQLRERERDRLGVLLTIDATVGRILSVER